MITKVINNFNLKQIAESGQCFRMLRLTDNKYSIIALGKYLEIEQHQNQFLFSCDEKEFNMIWLSYFDLLTNYQDYIDLIEPQDSFLSTAANFGSGIRILKQDLWETIITFIISQNNNIPRIKKNIEQLCYCFGNKETSASGKIYYTFPSSKTLAHLSIQQLKDIRLGYRDNYIIQIAKEIYSGSICLKKLSLMSYQEAYNTLIKYKGIGKKVANCICLFGLYCIDAFPIDTHIKTILAQYYPNGFPLEKYKNCAGIIQQYMFYYKLQHK